MSDLKLVIFDLDGTLVEFHHDYLFEEADRIIDTLDHPPVERTALESCFSAFDFFNFVVWDEKDHFVSKFWEMFDHDNYPLPIPFRYTDSTLKGLADLNVKSCIVTARMTTEQKLIDQLSHTSILDTMDVVVPRTDETIHWTDKRQMILDACERVGVSPAEAALVGDIPSDVTSAKNAGTKLSVAVESGGIERKVLEGSKPDIVLPDVGSLIKALFGG